MEEQELCKKPGNSTEKKDPPNVHKDVCSNTPNDRERASCKTLKRKLADPRVKKECGTLGKEHKQKSKGAKRRRKSKKTLYDYRASLELGTEEQTNMRSHIDY